MEKWYIFMRRYSSAWLFLYFGNINPINYFYHLCPCYSDSRNEVCVPTHLTKFTSTKE